MVEKNQFVIVLPFSSEHLFNRFNRNLKSVTIHTYPTTKELRPPQMSHTSSTSSLGATITHKWSAHIHKRLSKSMMQCSATSYTDAKSPTCSIAKHHVVCSHKVDTLKPSKYQSTKHSPQIGTQRGYAYQNASVNGLRTETMGSKKQSTLALIRMTFSHLSVRCIYETSYLFQPIVFFAIYCVQTIVFYVHEREEQMKCLHLVTYGFSLLRENVLALTVWRVIHTKIPTI